MCGFHSRTVLSSDPLATMLPSVEMATDLTVLEWPVKVLSRSPASKGTISSRAPFWRRIPLEPAGGTPKGGMGRGGATSPKCGGFGQGRKPLRNKPEGWGCGSLSRAPGLSFQLNTPIAQATLHHSCPHSVAYETGSCVPQRARSQGWRLSRQQWGAVPRALLTELMHMDADGSVGVQLRTQNATLLVGLTHPPPWGWVNKLERGLLGLFCIQLSWFLE